jgi:cell division protein ZapE
MTNGQQNHCNYPSQKLAARIARHTLNTDPAQIAVAVKLDHLLDQLTAVRSPRRFVPDAVDALLRWMGLFQRKTAKGLYIYGGVGRGKTMLMDMFHESLKALGREVPGAH